MFSLRNCCDFAFCMYTLKYFLISNLHFSVAPENVKASSCCGAWRKSKNVRCRVDLKTSSKRPPGCKKQREGERLKKKENLKLEETKERGDGVEAWICRQKKEEKGRG